MHYVHSVYKTVYYVRGDINGRSKKEKKIGI